MLNKTPLFHQRLGPHVFLSFSLFFYLYFWLIIWSAKAGCITQGILASFLLSLSYHQLLTTRFRSIKGPQQSLKRARPGLDVYLHSFFFVCLFYIYIFFHFFIFFFYLWWILSYIEMKQPWVYMCSPSQSPLPHPSPPVPSRFSQCTRSERLSHASNLGW